MGWISFWKACRELSHLLCHPKITGTEAACIILTAPIKKISKWKTCYRVEDLLDSRQLRAFLALARTGSFTAAAKQLHLTQSAISHAIKILEEGLGCMLVSRSARQVGFTRHGRELLHHAEGIEHRMKQAREALRSLDGSPRGTLRIGCTTAASQFLLPGVLREFKESFPFYDIKVLPGGVLTEIGE